MNEKNGELRNQLKEVRTRLGLSQQELASAAGIARQTIGGIEAGTYALSLTVALRLARILGCSVEELFWLEGDLPTVTVALADAAAPDADTASSIRVMLGQVQGQWIAYPLTGERAFRQEMIPADGLGTPDASSKDARLTVQLLDAPDALSKTVLLAGCAPSLSLWARSAERWHPGLRVHWTHANSMMALQRLKAGQVHAAGVHLFDAATGEENLPFVRQVMDGVPTVLVNLGVWEEGLLVAQGNPKGVCGAADLAQPRIRLANREPGAGARLLLDTLLEQEGVPASSVAGYDREFGGHLDIARAIQAGSADAGVSTASVAAIHGLSFVPIRSVRYDLAVRKEFLPLPQIQQLLDTLHHRWVRSQLSILGGYDTVDTGSVRE